MKFIINNIVLFLTVCFTGLLFVFKPEIGIDLFLGIIFITSFLIITSSTIVKHRLTEGFLWGYVHLVSLILLGSVSFYASIHFKQKSDDIKKIATKYKSLTCSEVESQFTKDSINNTIKYFSHLKIANNRPDIINKLKTKYHILYIHEWRTPVIIDGKINTKESFNYEALYCYNKRVEKHLNLIHKLNFLDLYTKLRDSK